jgi:hypothetical protein
MNLHVTRAHVGIVVESNDFYRAVDGMKRDRQGAFSWQPHFFIIHTNKRLGIEWVAGLYFQKDRYHDDKDCGTTEPTDISRLVPRSVVKLGL